jgi:IS1 family transposase
MLSVNVLGISHCRLKKSGCDRAARECLPRQKIWLWTAVDHFKTGILGWVLGDHSAKTFANLWKVVGQGQCHFYVTDSDEQLDRLINKIQPFLKKAGGIFVVSTA